MVVTAIGEETEMGKVARWFKVQKPNKPLSNESWKISVKTGYWYSDFIHSHFAIQAVRIFLGDSQDYTVPLVNAFMFAVAVAVAAIPEASNPS